MADQVRIELDGGKYTYIRHENCRQEALRYGEPWRDLIGDNLVASMADEIVTLREELELARGQRNESNRAIERLRDELAALKVSQGAPVGAVVVHNGTKVGMLRNQDLEAGAMLYVATPPSDLVGWLSAEGMIEWNVGALDRLVRGQPLFSYGAPPRGDG